MAVHPAGLSTVCQGLYRLLGGLRHRHSEQTPCGGGQRERLDELHRTPEQHAEAADFSVGEEDTVLFQEARESHWCNSDIHPRLQSSHQRWAGRTGRIYRAARLHLQLSERLSERLFLKVSIPAVLPPFRNGLEGITVR